MKNNFRSIGAAVLAAVICISVAGCKSKEQKALDALNKLDKELTNELGGNNGGNNAYSAPVVSKPEPKPLDPFENLEVEFEGISPKITAKIKGENSNVSYSLDKSQGLKNGDKVTVTAEIPNNKKDEFVLSSESKEFTVSDRPYYIMKLSDLTDSDIKTLSKKITDLVPGDIESHNGGGAGSTVNSLDFIGNVNLTKNDSNYRLYFVYKANVTFAKVNKTEDYIFSAYFGYIYKDKDGTLTFEDGKPGYASLGDMSLTVDGTYVGGAYASVDSLYASLSGFGAERESNVKE